MSARYLLAFVCVALLLTVAAGQTCCDTEKGCGKAGTKEDCAAVCDITAGNAQVCKGVELEVEVSVVSRLWRTISVEGGDWGLQFLAIFRNFPQFRNFSEFIAFFS